MIMPCVMYIIIILIQDIIFYEDVVVGGVGAAVLGVSVACIGAGAGAGAAGGGATAAGEPGFWPSLGLGLPGGFTFTF